MGMAVEYMCTVCGKKISKAKGMGRPDPGTCPRAKTAGRPHRWVKNREWESSSTVPKNAVERYMVVGGKKVKL